MTAAQTCARLAPTLWYHVGVDLLIVPNSWGSLQEFNSNHEPAGTSIGGRFARSNGSDVKALPAWTPQTLDVLREGSVTGSDNISDGANTSMAVDLQLEGGATVKALYKPEVGETWHSSFTNPDINKLDVNGRDLSLAEREAMAYEVDQLLGTNMVPETILRTELDGVDISDSSEDGSGYDSEEIRQQYEDWKDQNMDRAYEVVGDQMASRFNDARDEHLADVERRFDEMVDLWNEVVDEHPEVDNTAGKYGLDADKAPLLPMGSLAPRQRAGLVLDPLHVIEDAQVDVTSKFTAEERAKVKAELEQAYVHGGYEHLGDLDPSRARSLLDRDQWMEDHADSEARLLDSAVMSFDAWKQDKGYDSGNGGGGSGRPRNDEAPHPHGGSLQRWAESTYGNLTPESSFELAALDYALGSLDRHRGNLLFAPGTGRPIAIDNGYSMPSVPSQLRTPAFSYVKSEVAPERFNAVRAQLASRLANTDWDGFIKKHPAMHADQIKLFKDRIAALRKAMASPTGFATLLQATPTMWG